MKRSTARTSGGLTASEVIRAGGGHPITNAHLDKLTPAEFDSYIRTGKTPKGWRKRNGKKKR